MNWHQSNLGWFIKWLERRGPFPPALFIVGFYRQICVVFSGEGFGYRTGELPAKLADMWRHIQIYWGAFYYSHISWMEENLLFVILQFILGYFKKYSMILIILEWQITWLKKKTLIAGLSLSGLRSHCKIFSFLILT